MPESDVSQLAKKVETEIAAWETDRKTLNEIMGKREEQLNTLGKSDTELREAQVKLENTIKAQEDKIEGDVKRLSSELEKIRPELDELAKRVGRTNPDDRGPNGNATKTAGQEVIESATLKQFHESLNGDSRVSTPDISVKSLRSRYGASDVLSDQTTNFIAPFRPDLIAAVERRLFFRDLVGTTPIGRTASVLHIKELGFRGDADVLTVSGIVHTTGTATVTTATSHNLVPGNLFEVLGADQAGYNGVHVVITAPTATTITYAVDSGTVSPATGTMTLTRLVASGAAAGTAEGSAMPQSSVRWEEESIPVRLIGHWIAVSQILLDDLPQMASFIDRRLAYGIEFEIEEQGLYGTGAGQQFQGLLTHPRRLQLAKGSDTLPDAILRAIAHSYQADYEPTTIWMHPLDYYYGDGTDPGLLNYKDDQNAFQFLELGEGRVNRALDGIRIVVANSVRQGDLGVIDLQRAATLYDRQQASISVTNSHDDHFPRNMLAIKAFERMALGVHYGPAIVHMDLTS